MRGLHRSAIRWHVVAPTLNLGEAPLTTDTVAAVARRDCRVELSHAVKERVEASWLALQKAKDAGGAIYGLNRQVGAQEVSSVAATHSQNYQLDLLRSHAWGCGELMPRKDVRAMLLARAHSLAQGYSAVSANTLEALVALINSEVDPVVYSQGSAGSSDLHALSHASLVLVGEGEAYVHGTRMPAPQALKQCGLSPITLTGRDGLALINGHAQLTAVAALALEQVDICLSILDETLALTCLTAGIGQDAFSTWTHGLKPGPAHEHFGRFLPSHGHTPRLRTILSLRQAHTVVSAARESLQQARAVTHDELNTVVDNPLVHPDGALTNHAANCDGTRLALATNHTREAIAAVCTLLERLSNYLLDPALNGALPAFLAAPQAMNLMGCTYAQNALLLRMRTRLGAGGMHSAILSNGTEDYNSMATESAMQLAEAASSFVAILALHLLVVDRAIHLSAVDIPEPLASFVADLRCIIGAARGTTLTALREAVEDVILDATLSLAHGSHPST